MTIRKSIQTMQLSNGLAAEPDPVYYPETDGKPMAESDLHRDLLFYIIHLLQRFFAGRRIYVTGNLLVYYEKGNNRKSVSPDCFVVRDVEPKQRASYKIWEEGRGPEVVFEVSSKSTHREDITNKMRLYAQLGVREYFIYDPTSDYLDPPLIAYTLTENQEGGNRGYVPMAPLNEAVTLGEFSFVPGEGEAPEYECTLLGLRVTLDDGNNLTFFDVETGERLLSDEEARLLAEQQAAEARQRAETAEAENARLRAEVEQLRKQSAKS
ncbi:MAG: Uma2 family endonuclease [Caldilineaceae bacterium]|nr:Uma2 family endonuclease [Caldilineaceae bacterium]